MSKKKELTPLTCSCCGKRIIKGRAVYKVKGCALQWCSAWCALYAMTNFYTEVSTGYEETQHED